MMINIIFHIYRLIPLYPPHWTGQFDNNEDQCRPDVHSSGSKFPEYAGSIEFTNEWKLFLPGMAKKTFLKVKTWLQTGCDVKYVITRLKLARVLAWSFKTVSSVLYQCRDLLSGFSGWLFVYLSCGKLCFVCGSSWKQSAGWQGMKELPGSSLMLPSRRPADSLHGPPSPALPGGLRPAQGPLCDVGCLIKANASWIPRPSFPLSLYLSRRWLRVRAARELGFTLLTQTVSLFASAWLGQDYGWKELKRLEECVCL